MSAYIQPADDVLRDTNDIGQIGEGGDGAVHVFRGAPGHAFAVKYYKGEETTTYINECNTLTLLKDLRSPQAPPVIEIFAADDPSTPHHRRIVLEYCPAGDLREYGLMHHKFQQRVEEVTLWRFYRNLVDGLAFLHSGYGTRHYGSTWRPIVHRDIKPSNILLRLTGWNLAVPHQVVLADFGRAAFFNLHEPFFEGGTPNYTPPEQPYAGTEGDVWGVGAIMHFLALGKPPIADASEWPRRAPMSDDDWREIPRKAYPLVPKYSSQLDRLVLRALAFNPLERWTAMQLVQANWPVGTADDEADVPMTILDEE
ncbi:uncharacterized protein K452DRAFT_302884 [Aplosporella prunicola CBS 121167]|uniref:non-specific serine/threonine protein kinase n=1 Tax=Aplosporella prunicola CBS 121167 TaxID=1176127 RepID=A0A6A6AWB4_9PEZI|nr:uncharacterized protein K452DRAFT_302884 [Aplosporella prunicola CBS 121167]KAF2136292.1 hypothetical protein K452DRAFT_302884 [Aplosporella prunicola CBS 121167]